MAREALAQMGRISFSAVLLALAAVGCGSRQATIYTTGDAAASGARVFVDGQLIGIMTPETLSTVSPPENRYANIDIPARHGRRHLMVISTQGDTVFDTLDVKSDTYWSVDFEQQRRIRRFRQQTKNRAP